MIVERDELCDRIAAQVATLSGYASGDSPFDPGESPAELAPRVFAVLIPSTEFVGNRQQIGEPCEVRSRVVVRVEAPVGMAGPERAAARRRETQAERALTRKLLARDTWSIGLRITARSVSQEMREDPQNPWMVTEHVFEVGHQVQL